MEYLNQLVQNSINFQEKEKFDFHFKYFNDPSEIPEYLKVIDDNNIQFLQNEEDLFQFSTIRKNIQKTQNELSISNNTTQILEIYIRDYPDIRIEPNTQKIINISNQFKFSYRFL